MNQTLKLPVGIENFEDIRKLGFYYIDKTKLIEQLLQNWGKVNLFTRPRRFGKTLNMSMLRTFFEIGMDKSPFEGLYISKNKELCDEYMGKYPVIFLSLKGIDGLTFEEAIIRITTIIKNEARRHHYLKNSDKLIEEEIKQFQSLLDGKADDITDSIRLLSELLCKHYGKKTIILIDEYDVPLDKAFQKGYYDEMVELMRGLLGQVLKTNDFLQFAVLTGCLRISKESIFTGLNNFEVLSTLIVNKNIEPTFSLDTERLKKDLDDISTKLPDKIIESSYYIDNNNLIITKGQDGNIVDVSQMITVIENNIKNLNVKDNKIEIITKSKKPNEVDIEKIYNEVHKDAVDAYFTQEPLAVFPSENGMDFDISIEDAKKLLNESEKECTIPLKVLYPNVTTNMIGSEAFPDQLSSFSTNYSAQNVNRTTNLRLAANKINGTVVMPGEEFSYNKVVGERTIAAGYKEAPIYVSGRVEDGLGGGICQITTTLYNAVVYANLEITERTNHQFVPSYAGASRDATVVYGAIDFKFKNNRNYPIKILCSVSSGVANFQILGLKTSEDYDVEIYSRITSKTSNSINSEAYKILKKDGNIISQSLLSKDTYKRH